MHSCEDLCKNCVGGHWICFYYDGKNIFISDSINSNQLNVSNEMFLRKLFPHFDEIPKYFQIVQYQNNADDCAVFAIAFAISLFFQQNPSKIIYDTDQMRYHLYDMFERNKLTHFPTVTNESPNKHFLYTETTVTSLNHNKVAISKSPIVVKNVKPNTDQNISDQNKSCINLVKYDHNKNYSVKVNNTVTSGFWKKTPTGCFE